MAAATLAKLDQGASQVLGCRSPHVSFHASGVDMHWVRPLQQLANETVRRAHLRLRGQDNGWDRLRR